MSDWEPIERELQRRHREAWERTERPCMRPPPKPERARVRPSTVWKVAGWVMAISFMTLAAVHMGLRESLVMFGGSVLFAAVFVVVEHWVKRDRWPWEDK